MTIEDIKSLIDYVKECRISRFRLRTPDKTEIDIETHDESHATEYKNVIIEHKDDVRKQTKKTLAQTHEKESDQIVDKQDSSTPIVSPMVGTFYRSANPESKPYVEIGDTVRKGQTLCIIEAMKLFNEIECEHSCKIVDIVVKNATPVEFDQVLFKVELID